MQFPFIIQLIAGRGNCYTFLIESNLDTKAILQSYSTGVDIIGVDLVKGTPGNWAGNHIPKILFQKFLDAGFSPGWFDLPWESYCDKFGLPLDEDCWFEMYLFTCEKGNLAFEYQKLVFNEIYIGGINL